MGNTPATGSTGFRLRQVAAFAAVYLIWGSTYLAIRFAIETLPGFTMAGVRFLTAGAILYALTRGRGAARPTLANWRSAVIVGSLLLLFGNGSVVWAEERLASGLVALLIGTEPLWVAVLLWLSPNGRRPVPRVWLALGIGFAGAAVLSWPQSGAGFEMSQIHLPSVLACLFACATWAGGSLYARNAPLPSSAGLSTALQMLAGGALLLVAGGLGGEWSQIDLASVSTRSWLALAYLIVFGSLIAFSAYSWLIRTTEPTLVATYAYVNPVVAVFLGWWLASEPVGPRTIVASVLIVGAVVLLGTAERRKVEVPPPHDVPKDVPSGDFTPQAKQARRLSRAA